MEVAMSYAVRKKPPVVRSAYDRIEVTSNTSGPTLTKQEFADECDINVLMKRYERDGLITHVSKYQGQYADFIGAPDYHTAHNKVIEANEMFMSLPAHIRTKFQNDPGQFLEFVAKEENAREMVEMGLFKEGYTLPDPAPVKGGAEPDAKSGTADVKSKT